MSHLSSEQLVMVYYGEHDDAHLAECERCRSEYARLEAALRQAAALSVPERGEGYGREVWARIAPRLAEREQHRRWWHVFGPPRRWALAGAMAALIAAAFWTGRFWPYQAPALPNGRPIAGETRERILIVAVSDHLERSQMALLELVNSHASGSEVDITAEQQRADDLVAANRLYRQTATWAGDAGLASVLDDLERVLLEIARGPSRLSSSEFEDLRRRIEAQGIVFKVRVIDSKLRSESAEGSPSL